MNGSPLNNLVRIGQLKTERPDIDELKGLVHSGRVRLTDAKLTTTCWKVLSVSQRRYLRVWKTWGHPM